jgi:hypothetical protein
MLVETVFPLVDCIPGRGLIPKCFGFDCSVVGFNSNHKASTI